MPPTVVLTWLFMLLQILAVKSALLSGLPPYDPHASDCGAHMVVYVTSNPLFPRHLLGRMHLCRHARKALLRQKCSLYMHAT